MFLDLTAKMKNQLQLAIIIFFVLVTQFALALIPAIRQLADLSADVVATGEDILSESFLSVLRPFAGPATRPKRPMSRREWADPEIDALPEEIISRWGYSWEKYDVITEDGYILALYRIPHSRLGNASEMELRRPVVFLQHGLECSCTSWIENVPNQAAGFMFADAGFDVWMGNFRGNTYSKRHIRLSPKDHDFWQFSWDEMAHYDLPALIDKALNISGAKRLYYMAHSKGTLTGFALFSQNQEFAKKIIKFYALGPIYTVKDINGVFRWFAPFVNNLEFLFNIVGMDEFLPNSWLMNQLAKYFCGNSVSDMVCTNILFLFGGPDTHQTNVSRLPVYLSHTPAGTSTQTIVHLGQMVNSGKCDMYDYGRRKNQAIYNQDKPPEYDVSKMQVPVAIYWGGQDWMATPADVERLVPKLQHLFDNRYLDKFNHLDFMWGLRAAPDVYAPILNDIKADFRNSGD